VIRVSGWELAEAASRVCPGLDLGQVRRAQLVLLREGSGRPVERAVAIPYAGPASYTGEDMLELMIHGSPALVRRTMELFVEAGCRPAEPGELTRRAVANGKMDLVQAEAVADLVAAETEQQVRLAGRLLAGELSRRVEALRAGMIDLLARLEAGLDFSPQGVEIDRGDLERRRGAVVAELEELLATRRRGQRVRDGVRVVLLGPPNAGKSTLFNRLLRTERSIVTPHPGTTRDFIEAEVEVAGLRVILVDTAGIGEGGDAVEREGVRRSLGAAGRANVLLVLHPMGEDPTVTIETPPEVPVLRVRTKADLQEDGGASGEDGFLAVSALTGQGWEELESALEEVVSRGLGGEEGSIAVNVRQAEALERARESMLRAPMDEAELAAEEIREAMERLRELLGEVRTEEVLDRVFENFCLGK